MALDVVGRDYCNSWRGRLGAADPRKIEANPELCVVPVLIRFRKFVVSSTAVEANEAN